MVGFLQTQEQTRLLSESVVQYQLSVDLSLIQYREGLTSYQRVVDVQRYLTQQQDNLASTTGSVAVNLVAMYKALGGAGSCVRARNSCHWKPGKKCENGLTGETCCCLRNWKSRLLLNPSKNADGRSGNKTGIKNMATTMLPGFAAATTLAGYFAIMNPIANTPVFISMLMARIPTFSWGLVRGGRYLSLQPRHQFFRLNSIGSEFIYGGFQIWITD